MADVFGTYSASDAARTVVANQVVTLRDSTTAIEPWIGTVHRSHNIANVRVGDVSVDIARDWRVEVRGPFVPNPAVDWRIPISIRIHFGFPDERRDTTAATKIAQSIMNYLLSHITLGSNCRVYEVPAIREPREFPESKTIGVEIELTVGYSTVHS